MKVFGLYILLSLLTGNPLLALGILLLVFFLAERRFIGVLPDLLEPWRRGNRLRSLKREVQVNPANAEANLELGEIHFRKGQYQEALSFLDQASSKMAGHPLYHFYYGAASYHMGKIKDGKEEIKKAVDANPKASFGEPYLYLLRIYLEEKQPDEKIEAALNQLMLYGSPKTHYLAGKLFLSANDRPRARRLFRETIDNYEACRGALRRTYRRWAVLSKINLWSTR